jgi:hypothetical protein
MSASVTPVMHVWRPSSARRLVLDGFATVARGAAVAAPLPQTWPGKDPGDVLDYQFDISAALLGNEGDQIASVAVSASPAGPGDLVVNSISADGAVLVFWFAGGVAGTTYVVQVTVVTQAGRTIGRALLLPVVALATTAAPLGALTTNAGAVLSDQNGNPILMGA